MQAGRLRLDEQLCFALYAATSAIIRSYRPRLDQVGLTYPQYLILLVLWQDGTSSARNIGKRLKLHASVILPLIEQLAEKELVELHRSPDDGALWVRLTGVGAELESTVALLQQEVVCDTRMPVDALEALRSELSELVIKMHQEYDFDTESAEGLELAEDAAPPLVPRSAQVIQLRRGNPKDS